MTPPVPNRTDGASPLALEIERDLRAPPERVFQAWTDPEEMAAWFSPNPAHAVRAEVDLRVGGHYRVVMGNDVVTGQYREIVPPSRLRFTWRWQGSADATESLVTVELEAWAGGTRLHLRHERFAEASELEGHTDGWGRCLPRLEAHVAAAA